MQSRKMHEATHFVSKILNTSTLESPPSMNPKADELRERLLPAASDDAVSSLVSPSPSLTSNFLHPKPNNNSMATNPKEPLVADTDSFDDHPSTTSASTTAIPQRTTTPPPPSSNTSLSTSDHQYQHQHQRQHRTWRPPTPPSPDTSRAGSRKRWRIPSLFQDDKNTNTNTNMNSNREEASLSSSSAAFDESLLLQEEISSSSDPNPNPDPDRNTRRSRTGSISSASTIRGRSSPSFAFGSSSQNQQHISLVPNSNNPKKSRIGAGVGKKIMNTLIAKKRGKGGRHEHEYEDADDLDDSYHMMKSRHNPSKSSTNMKIAAAAAAAHDDKDTAFFYEGIEELEAQRQRRQRRDRGMAGLASLQQGQDSEYYNDNDLLLHAFGGGGGGLGVGGGGSKYRSTLLSSSSGYTYFDLESRRNFLRDHEALNVDIPKKQLEPFEDDDDEEFNIDFKNLFTFGFSPHLADNDNGGNGSGNGSGNRDGNNDGTNNRTLNAQTSQEEFEDRMPAISDIRKSSLSYIYHGRIQMRLPGENIRLIMDDMLKPGILSIERMPPKDEVDLELGQASPMNKKPPPSARGRDRGLGLDRGRGHVRNSTDNSRILVDDISLPSRVMSLSTPQSTTHDYVDDDSNNDTDVNDYDIGRDDYDDDNERKPLAARQSANDNYEKKTGEGDRRHHHHHHHHRHHHHERLPELNYLLTVDQDLYKRLLSEVVHSRMPCGLYYCCHDSVDGSKHVNIGVAIMILTVVFILLFIATCYWPTD